MPLQLPRPIIYPITSGRAKTPDILRFLQNVVTAQLPLFQIREKSLPARELYDLTMRAVEITRGSRTRLLVNDRMDIALAAGADGVHLTSRSLPADVVRNICGPDFLIGVSTHSLAEAQAAQATGADFVVFGPIFDTESKRAFGEPQGLDKLREVAKALGDFPVLAIGGITRENLAACIDAGASGIAGISLFEHLGDDSCTDNSWS
jgi:thiamine-phosphate pyrophosphorylase